MGRKRTLSLCVIVQEEESAVEECLESVGDAADEIILVDIGSAGKIAETAEKFGAKVYSFPWKGSISDVRNYSISKAGGKWVLLMDDCEVFEKSGREALADYVQHSRNHGCHFTVLSPAENPEGGLCCTMPNTLRLLRNDGLYCFRGKVREQLCRKDGKKVAKGLFERRDFRIYRFSRFEEAAKERQKRKENCAALLKELEEEPENPFLQFHLGNEYLSDSDYKNAVCFYDRAYANMDETQPYAPHLVYRRAIAYDHLKQYERSLRAIEEALAVYPQCTDLEQLRGAVYSEWGRYTLAIDSFQRCMQMGDPPPELRLAGDNPAGPLLLLADLYVRLCDYERAFQCYKQAVVQEPFHYQTLYSVGHVLNQMYEDKRTAVAKLTAFFSNLEDPANLIVLTDILIEEKLYAYGVVYWDILAKQPGYEPDKTFLRAKLYFYTQEYEKAWKLFEPLAATRPAGAVFRQIGGESAEYLYLLSLILGNGKTGECIRLAKGGCDETTVRTFRQIWNVYRGNGELAFRKDENWKRVLNAVTLLFDRLIRAREFDLFQKLLYVLNDINSPAALTALAGVYFSNGYDTLAADQIVRSVRELNYLDAAGLNILLRTSRK